MAVTNAVALPNQQVSSSDFSTSRFLQSVFRPTVNDIITHVGVLRENVTADAVHDCRVAIRTIRSHLDTFAPLLKRKVAKNLDEELQWLGKHIGKVRDIDVHIVLVKKLSDSHEQDFQLVLNELERIRNQNALKLSTALIKKRVDALLTQLVHYSLRPPIRKKVLAKTPLECKALVTQLVSNTWVTLFSEISALSAKPKISELHKVRITAKRCKYAYDAATQLETLPTDHISEHSRKLQQTLGAINDKATLKRWVKQQEVLDAPTVQELLEALDLSKRVSKKKLFG